MTSGPARARAGPVLAALANGLLPMRRVAERRHLLETELKQSGFVHEAQTPQARLGKIDTLAASEIPAARRSNRAALAAD